MLVLVSLGALALLNTAVIRYHLLSSRPPLTRDLCKAQNRGRAWPNQGEAFKALKGWLGAAGSTDIPDKPVDITTVSTLAQLLAPGLKLVLDPIMYLQTQLKDPPPGLQMPRVVHFTMKVRMCCWRDQASAAAAAAAGCTEPGVCKDRCAVAGGASCRKLGLGNSRRSSAHTWCVCVCKD